jgi:hypothetical protein
MSSMLFPRLARAPPDGKCKRLRADLSGTALRRMSGYPCSAICHKQCAMHPPRSTEAERESLSAVYRIRSSQRTAISREPNQQRPPSSKEKHPMFAVIGTVDNYTILPSPVLDDADPKGYRIEQRLQVTLKLAANERQQYTVEFRLGDESQAPSTELLTKWLESGEQSRHTALDWPRCPLSIARRRPTSVAGVPCRSANRPRSLTPLSSSLAPPWPCSNLALH